MDVAVPLTATTEGHKYILTFQDELSKYTIAVPTLQQDAETIDSFCWRNCTQIWHSASYLNRPKLIFSY